MTIIASGYVYSSTTGFTKQGEHNDCCVQALANAADIPYDTVHAAMKEAGRKDRHRTPWSIAFAVYKSFGFKPQAIFGTTDTANFFKSNFKEVPRFSGINLENILKVLKKDRNYILVIRGHAFAVVKGEVVDKGAMRANSYVTALFSDRESLFD